MIQSLFTGLSSLIQHQKALDVTSNNIANVNTEGYTKQRTNFETNPMRDMGNIHIGTGVMTQSVERVHDEAIFSQFKNSLGDYSQANEEFKKLYQLKNNLVGQDMNGNYLSELTEGFFDSVQRLSESPDNQALKAETKIKGQSLIQRGVEINTIFTDSKTSIEKEKTLLLDEATSYLKEIDNLTKSINEIEAGNGANMPTKDYANELRDKRDLYESKLSQIGNFKVFKDSVSRTGEINITDYGNNANYNYTFDENGGRLAGLNSTLKVIDKFQTSFKAVFSDLGNKINEFISSDMSNPNDMLQWRYDTKPAEQFNNEFVSFSAYVDSVQNKTDSTEAIFKNHQEQQELLSKVNIDEEMTNLIRYQRAYEAAAKVIQTSDEMLQTLLDMKR